MAVAPMDYRSGIDAQPRRAAHEPRTRRAAGEMRRWCRPLKTVESLGLRKGIEDILITLADQYHLIRLVPHIPGLFLYLVLDIEQGQLALARYKLTDIERTLKV